VRRRLLLLAVSCTILAVLWWRVGWREVAGGIAGLDYAWFAVAVSLFIPQVWLSGWRWHRLVYPRGEGSLGNSIQLVLAASSLNIVLPSKLGDLAKGLFAVRHDQTNRVEHGLALGIFEKGVDTASLAAWMVMASLLAPPREPLGWGLVTAGCVIIIAVGAVAGMGRGAVVTGSSSGLLGRVGGLLRCIAAVSGELRVDRGRFAAVVGASLALWLLHIAQFALVQVAAGGEPYPILVASRVPMAILIGLLPVSFAGVGTRDAAMVYLLAPALGRSTALVLGLFATFRYVVVAIAGIPFVARVDFDRLRRESRSG